MEGSLALDGIATSAPYNYSALDPKSMERPHKKSRYNFKIFGIYFSRTTVLALVRAHR